MTASVRLAHYETESLELVNVLQANLPYRPHSRLFEWLYRQNPEGNALAWIAIDSPDQRIIGVAAAFPRRIYRRGEEGRGYVLGDFCIDAGHRSLGLALALQRACLEGLSATGADFAFDFPSRTMLTVYKRLRIEANFTMIRYAKLLRVDRKVTESIPVPAIARGFSTVMNAALRLSDAGLKRFGGVWTIATEAGPWEEEFTQAAGEWSPRVGVCVARTAAYLNWRYREHPLRKYEMLTARQGSRLCGYLIYHSDGEDFHIADMLAEDDTVRSALLAEVTTAARKRGAHTVRVPWLATHSGKQLLEESGFRPRESSPVVLMALGQVTPAIDELYLTSGDWEG